MKPFVGVVALLGSTVTGCGLPEENQAIAQAETFVRNTTGQVDAPIWDEMICYHDEGLEKPKHFTGFVNGGEGPQLFVVNIDYDGKPDGEVDLKPRQYSDDSEPGYWNEIEFLRKADNGKRCSNWLDAKFLSTSIYWEAIQEGRGPGDAMMQVHNARMERRKSNASE